jgi:ferric-dicitrate binding protein FerR (iron transport regulator)
MDDDSMNVDHDLLFRVLEGRAIESEQRKFNEWLESSARNREFFEELQAMRQSVLLEQSSYDAAHALGKVRAAIQRNNPASISEPVVTEPPRKRHYWIISSLALLFFAVSLLVVNLLRKPRTPQFTGKVYQTMPGERIDVTLDDGSVIYLNAASRVTLDSEFNGSTREVLLTGEAFFQVSPNADRPFKVHTETLYTQVLGTSFNVRAYPEDESTHVTVESGKVRVGVGEQELSILAPGMNLGYDKKQQQWKITHDVDSELFTGWHNGVLRFEDAPLETIITSIERYYGIGTIVWENAAAKHCRYTVHLEHRDLPNTLRILEITTNMVMTLEDSGELRITGNACE